MAGSVVQELKVVPTSRVRVVKKPGDVASAAKANEHSDDKHLARAQRAMRAVKVKVDEWGEGGSSLRRGC